MNCLELKDKLKEWEKAFAVVHGKKPTKKDIDLAPAEIRRNYVEFWKITKSSAKISLKPAKIHENATNLRLKRDDSFSKTLLTRRRSNLELSTIFSISAAESSSSTTSFDKISRKSDDFKEKPKPAVDFEMLRNDKSFRVEAIAGVQPTVQNLQKFSPFPLDVEEDSLSQLPNEIDFRKRQNLCKFSFAVDLEREKSELASSDVENIEKADGNMQEIENENETDDLFPTTKIRKSRKSNENFVKLDLKHKKFSSKAGKKLKGAALKRHLLKMKYKKLKKMF